MLEADEQNLLLKLTLDDSPRRDPYRPYTYRLPQAASILPPPLAKPLATRSRLQALRALVLRNENFCPPLPGTVRSRGAEDTWMKLTSTSNLLGRPNGRFLLFGILTSTPDGRWCLEDEDGRVELDLTDAVPGEGIFTLGGLVLVEGRYADEGEEGQRFHVHAIGHPPSETRSRAREMYGHIDWTGKGVISLKEERSLDASLQKHHPDVSFVVLSDLHLDVPRTFHSLKAVLRGYIDADFVPFLFVFCGNFLSEEGRRKADGGLTKYNEAFNALAELLATFPSLFTKSRFLFVPGPLDPYATPILPRKALPKLLSDPFIDRLSTRLNTSRSRVIECVQFVSNPCRVRFWGKELVIFRDDLLERMRRNGVSIGEGKDVREGGMKKFVSIASFGFCLHCPCEPSSLTLPIFCVAVIIITSKKAGFHPPGSSAPQPARSTSSTRLVGARPHATAVPDAQRLDPGRLIGAFRIDIRVLPRTQPGIVQCRLRLVAPGRWWRRRRPCWHQRSRLDNILSGIGQGRAQRIAQRMMLGYRQSMWQYITK